MAHLWPQKLPLSIRQDRRRRAEVRVYDRLAAELDDSFHVFYSSPWLGTDNLGNEKDGECDFMIAHATLGYLSLEIKGGGISYDPAARQWWSTDEHGFRHAIKDPVEQARSAKHELLKKLKASRSWKERWIHTVHGVVFPDAAKIPRDLGADRPAYIFCCAAEFATGCRKWIESRMSEGQKAGTFQPLGADGIAAFEHILAQPFSLSFRLAGAMAEAKELLGVLEPTQFHILEHIADVPRAEIRGGAGTGKTVIAQEDAKRSALAGRRTLLTCHSRPLSLELQRNLAGLLCLTVASFHAVCLRTAREAGLDVPASNSQEFFDSKLPELLMNAVAARPDLRWDHIIVDEGQDFQASWWIALESALVPDGTLRVFSDSNQRVYPNRNVHKELQLVPIRLGRNLRNTKAIHNAASVHYDGPDMIAEGPDGKEVKWIEANTAKAMIDSAYAEVRQLVYQDEVSPADIAVLVPNAEWIENFRITASHSQLEFANCDDLSVDRIVLDTSRRFKGLERPAIVAILPDTDPKVEMAYVSLSRARYYLAVVSSSAEFKWLRMKH